MEASEYLKHAGDSARAAVTRLEDAAMDLARAGNERLGLNVETTSNLLWRLAEHARFAESEVAKLHSCLRKEIEAESLPLEITQRGRVFLGEPTGDTEFTPDTDN